MATRREVDQRKTKLRADLQAAVQNGSLRSGEPLPPITQFAQEYRLSAKVVRQALEPLLAEGLLYTVPRVGTFVGRPVQHGSEFYLLVLPGVPTVGSYAGQIKAGFEQRIARLGGASLVMSCEHAQNVPRAELPELAGRFDFDSGADAPYMLPPAAPLVRFAKPGEDKFTCDTVTFDDEDGGVQAARHLHRLGHRHIAFLGLHGGADSGQFAWSFERAQGWKREMRQAGVSREGLLLFQPEPTEYAGQQTEASRRVAKRLLRRPEITAVIACNDLAALGLFDTLRDSGLPPAQWPAVVSFDDNLSASGYIVTALRLPWEEVGEAAADLLWERRHGRLTGAPTCRLIPMRLIPRLTSRAHWSLMAGQSLLASLEAS